MRLIAVEEHTSNSALNKASAGAMKQCAPDYYKGLIPELPYYPGPGQMRVDDARLSDMDANGIDMQILIAAASMWMPPEDAVSLATAANDELAERIAPYPDRFAAFATLPTPDPAASARELKRTADIGFKGAAIMGRPGEKFLDDPAYAPLLDAANETKMPLYLHPGLPLPEVQKAYYEGFSPVVSGRLLSFGWGWHLEAGIQAIRLILSGAFENRPDLQIILGHWGEMVPNFLERLDESLPPEATSLSRTISDTFRSHFYVTPSGMFSNAHLLFAMETLGVERILFSVDYPFISNQGAVPFLKNAPISTEDREKIAHKNAERLLRLNPSEN